MGSNGFKLMLLIWTQVGRWRLAQELPHGCVQISFICVGTPFLRIRPTRYSSHTDRNLPRIPTFRSEARIWRSLRASRSEAGIWRRIWRSLRASRFEETLLGFRKKHKKAMTPSRAYSRGFLGVLLCATLTTVESLHYQPQIYFARPGLAGTLSRGPTKYRGHVDCRKNGAVHLQLSGIGEDERGGARNSHSSMGVNKNARLMQLQVEAFPSSPNRH